MASRLVEELTREKVIITARNFRWNRKMLKWTVLVEGRELPARPLVLAAAGVPPNDPTNSHMAIAKLKALGFETRYEESMEEAGQSVKARYLDASTIVKLFVHEPYSDIVQAFFESHPKPFNTTSLCFAEAFTVLKRKWLEKTLSLEEYLKATNRLRIAAWGKEIEVHDYGFMDPFVQKDVDEIVAKYHLDVSDALQLTTLLKGPHSNLVHQSASVLITSDKGLTAAAVTEGVRVWNCSVEPAPPWA